MHKVVVLNEIPPVLADPTHVVPLSEYQNYRHCQPNITLATPASQKLVTSDLPDVKKEEDLVKRIFSPKGCPKNYSLVGSKDLQIISVDKSSLPNDLQIIKWDSRALRNVQVVNSSDSSSALPKDLKIIKLGYPENKLEGVPTVIPSRRLSLEVHRTQVNDLRFFFFFFFFF